MQENRERRRFEREKFGFSFPIFWEIPDILENIRAFPSSSSS